MFKSDDTLTVKEVVDAITTVSTIANLIYNERRPSYSWRSSLLDAEKTLTKVLAIARCGCNADT